MSLASATQSYCHPGNPTLATLGIPFNGQTTTKFLDPLPHFLMQAEVTLACLVINPTNLKFLLFLQHLALSQILEDIIIHCPPLPSSKISTFQAQHIQRLLVSAHQSLHSQDSPSLHTLGYPFFHQVTTTILDPLPIFLQVQA
jgi:hypothetical protein